MIFVHTNKLCVHTYNYNLALVLLAIADQCMVSPKNTILYYTQQWNTCFSIGSEGTTWDVSITYAHNRPNDTIIHMTLGSCIVGICL